MIIDNEKRSELRQTAARVLSLSHGDCSSAKEHSNLAALYRLDYGRKATPETITGLLDHIDQLQAALTDQQQRMASLLEKLVELGKPQDHSLRCHCQMCSVIDSAQSILDEASQPLPHSETQRTTS